MRKFCGFLIAICCVLAFTSHAQIVTNIYPTEIENFEAQTGTVIVKGFGEIGSVTTSAGTLSVRCKESTDVNSGQKEYGVLIAFDGNDRKRERAVVDDDEVNLLFNGLDYLNKITYDVTTLPSFEATFATKSGFRAVAYSARRQGGIQSFLQFGDNPRIPLSSDQMSQFQNLIGQAETYLNSLKSK
jgi:hypothetical protein